MKYKDNERTERDRARNRDYHGKRERFKERETQTHNIHFTHQCYLTFLNNKYRDNESTERDVKRNRWNET